jgi:hypothetical protein
MSVPDQNKPRFGLENIYYLAKNWSAVSFISSRQGIKLNEN